MSVYAIQAYESKRPVQTGLFVSIFCRLFILIYIFALRFFEVFAWMAELVDALVSGTSIRKDVQVRVLFQARGIYFAQMVELVDTPA